jgi:hypothetical protein
MRVSHAIRYFTASFTGIAVLAACSGAQSTMTPASSSLSASGGSSPQSFHRVRPADSQSTTIVVHNTWTNYIFPGCCITGPPTCPTADPYPFPAVPAGETSQPITLTWSCTQQQAFYLIYAPDKAAIDSCALVVTPTSGGFSYAISAQPNTRTECSYTISGDGHVVFTYAKTGS